jgi:N-acetyl-anhydromuramyl-L-alanine amidase AmpD
MGRMLKFAVTCLVLLVVVNGLAFGEGTLARFGPGQPSVQLDVAPNSTQLGPAFAKAANQYNVPLPLLLTLGYMGSGFEYRGDAPTVEGGYGVMALRDNILGADSLSLASPLTKIDKRAIILDPIASIIGGAAVLDDYAKSFRINRAKGLSAWLPVLIQYAGLDPENSKFWAWEVLKQLKSGLDVVNSNGERFAFDAQDIGSVNLASLVPPGLVKRTNSVGLFKTQNVSIMSADYGPAIWDPAATCNYSTATHSSDTIVIHTMEGSLAGTRSWFKNCDAQGSSHYGVGTDGTVVQFVSEAQTAWHASCFNSCSIGIEHEGYAAESSHPVALYNASAALCANICARRGIPKVRFHPATTCGGSGFCGHVDVTDCCCGTHRDPGAGWDWNYFMQMVGYVPVTSWVAMATTPSNGGYWCVKQDGAIFSYGNAAYYGGSNGISHQPIVGLAGTSNGGGYWQAAKDGGVFTYGNAPFKGSMGGTQLAAPIVGIAATTTNQGYWLTGSDGGMFCFGDAPFKGSMGGVHLNAPVVAIAATKTNNGYWLVASDGGIFAFGDAPFKGSMGGVHLNAPIVGMAASATSQGYWLVASDGGIFSFGDAPFKGSLGGTTLGAPICGIARSSTGQGYYLFGKDGYVKAFGDAPFYGDPK